MKTIFALASGEAFANALVWLVGAGLIAWVLWWFFDYIKLPEPFSKVAKVLIALFIVVILIRVILKLTGGSF